MSDPKDPTELNLSDEGFQLKFNGKAIFEVLLRGAVDWAKGSLGAGTMPALLKTVTVKSDAERDAYLLVAKSLMMAFRDQIGEELDQADIDEQENIVIQNKQLDLTAFELLNEKPYTFSIVHFKRPDQLPLLTDFSTAYRGWLKTNFGMSSSRARGLAAEFKYYFGYAFYEEVRIGVYSALNDWKKDEFLAEQKSLMNRQRYDAQLRAYYYGQSLGQQDVCLADMYIQPDFLVLDKLLSLEKQKELREEFNPKHAGHFIRTKFSHSVHDYFNQYFLEQKKSKFLDCEQEESRMLVLLGQPGHGKSSFCYRTAHDLLSSDTFGGSVHLIRLRETRKQVIQSPQEEFIRLLEREGVTPLIDWKNKQQPSVLLLDGLDELCMSQGLSDSDVRELIQECKRMVDDYPNLFIVLTSRFNYLPSDRLRQARILVLSLATLDETQQEHLINKYAESKKEVVNIDRGFLKEINESDQLQHIQELIELPILLQMILISKIDLRAANSRASIYNELFTQVLNRKWDQAGRLQKYVDASDFQPEDLRAYLAFLAFKIYQSPRAYLNRTEINSFPETKTFKREFLTSSEDDQGIDTVLKDVLTSFYLKERRKDQEDEQEEAQRQQYAIEFLHKSLYEYLCCEHLWTATKSIFLKPDGRAQYTDFAEVGERIQRLFAHTRLSEEMINYLNEIIDLDRECHLALQKAMSHTLPTMLDYGCLYQYPLVGDKVFQLYTHNEQSVHVFHCYWAFLGQLRIHEINVVDYFQNNWSQFHELHLQNVPAATLVEAYSLTDKLVKENLSQLLIFKQIFLRRQCFIKKHESCRPYVNEETTAKIKSWIQSTGAALLPMKLNFFSLNFGHTNFSGLLGFEISFIGADLRESNLRGADLNQANFSGANLNVADLCGAALCGANFSAVDLSGAYLRGADLRETDFEGAYLRLADLTGVDLRRANFNNINLRGANLRGADLTKVNLIGVDLSGADLSGANLNEADLSGANLSGVNFSGANLSRANLTGIKLYEEILLSLVQYKSLDEASKEYLSEIFYAEQVDYKQAGGLYYLFSPLYEEE